MTAYLDAAHGLDHLHGAAPGDDLTLVLVLRLCERLEQANSELQLGVFIIFKKTE